MTSWYTYWWGLTHQKCPSNLCSHAATMTNGNTATLVDNSRRSNGGKMRLHQVETTKKIKKKAKRSKFASSSSNAIATNMHKHTC